MFDIGWTEILVIAVVAIVFVGPKDLPKVLRTLAQALGKLRKIAGEFQTQFNEALKEAELDDLKRDVESIKNAATFKDVRDELNPFKQVDKELRETTAALDGDKRKTASGPMSSAPVEAEAAPATPSGNPSPEAAGSALDEMTMAEPDSAPDETATSADDQTPKRSSGA
ncbi:MAG: twin-arginine translocase subunit TatB [Hyphomicrobiales bacterium]|nr:twin-arginine translocase subunit TatB [Hyphomicrobiales bacterium]